MQYFYIHDRLYFIPQVVTADFGMFFYAHFLYNCFSNHILCKE